MIRTQNLSYLNGLPHPPREILRRRHAVGAGIWCRHLVRASVQAFGAGIWYGHLVQALVQAFGAGGQLSDG